MEVKSKLYKVIGINGIVRFLNEMDFYHYVFESPETKGYFSTLKEMRDWFNTNVVVIE